MAASAWTFRDAWAGEADGSVTGRVDGEAASVPLSAFARPAEQSVRGTDEAFILNTSLGRLFIDSLVGGPPSFDRSGAIGLPVPTGGHVLFDGPPGSGNPLARLELPLNDPSPSSALLNRIPLSGRMGYEEALQLYDVHLPDADWGRIAATEFRLDLPLLDYALLIGNIPEVRVKVGDDPDAFQVIAPLRLHLDAVKSGEVDATESFRGVDVRLTHASDGPQGQNSFHMEGSALADRLVLVPDDTTAPTAAGATLDTSGAPMLVTARLGAGDDVFDARASAADTEVRGGPDAGRFYAKAEVVSLGYGDGPVFAEAYQTAVPFATTADLLRDWLEDAAAAKLKRFEMTATIAEGTSVAESSTIRDVDDIAAARFFTGTAAGAPRDPYPEPLIGQVLFYAADGYNGLGVARTPDPPVDMDRDIRNPEIGEYALWTAQGLEHGRDVLAIRFGTDAIAARLDLSAFYSQERGPDAGEMIRVALYDNGKRVFEGDFASEEDTGAASPNQRYSHTPINPGTGHVTLDAEALGIKRFDEVRILGFQVDESSYDSNDMLLDGIRLVLKGQGYAVLGGDVLRAGGGADRFVYAAGDGVDRVEGFDPAEDQLVLAGIAADRIELDETKDGTAVLFLDDPDALVWLPGVRDLQATSAGGDTLIA
ncbi:hypothetical protein [Falsiroseomonas oryziterrae]|uniref:hypothetical protein n=1 Tax=Falsiroseomonas oryziterrae TaxID=2911368 RepID=UPI001F44FBC6|nr:hypothetical protein [Roseomonas sp. NPKOSM-4]